MPRRRRGVTVGGLILPAVLVGAMMFGQWEPPDVKTGVADGFGFAGLGLLAAVAIFDGRSLPLARLWGRKAVHLNHRSLAVWAVGFLVAHVLLLMLDDPHRLPLLNPISAPWRARLGMISAALLAAVLLSTRRRWKGRLSHRSWLWLHRLLFLGVIGTALGHVTSVGHYVESWPGIVIVAVVIAGALFGVRVVRQPVSRFFG